MHIVAHSMGNVVVSEALRSTDSPNISSYSPSQAAEVAGAFDWQVANMQFELGPIPIGPESAWRNVNSDLYPDTSVDMPPDHYRFTITNPHGATTDVTKELLSGGGATLGDSLGSYYRDIDPKVSRIVNYHNIFDAALGAWRKGQILKPGTSINPFGSADKTYRNEMYDCYRRAETDTSGNVLVLKRLCRETHITVNSRYENDGVPLIWDDQRIISSDNHNEEILSHYIPARTNPLGTLAVGGVVDQNVDFRQYGSSNQGHSAQFYNTYAERSDYWEQIIAGSLEFQPENRNKYSKLSQAEGVQP